jgi:hypothetical protein
LRASRGTSRGSDGPSCRPDGGRCHASSPRSRNLRVPPHVSTASSNAPRTRFNPRSPDKLWWRHTELRQITRGEVIHVGGIASRDTLSLDGAIEAAKVKPVRAAGNHLAADGQKLPSSRPPRGTLRIKICPRVPASRAALISFSTSLGVRYSRGLTSALRARFGGTVPFTGVGAGLTSLRFARICGPHVLHMSHKWSLLGQFTSARSHLFLMSVYRGNRPPVSLNHMR